MSVVTYPALARFAEGVCRLSFPDLPDLKPVEVSQPALLDTGRERLLAELHRLEQAGEEWPTPTALDVAMREAGPQTAAFLVDVTVDDTPVRVNISVGERLLRRIDEAAGKRDMSRSGFIASACRDRLGAEPGAKFDVGAGRLQEEVAAIGKRMDEVIGPQSPLGKALSELDQRTGDQLKRFFGQLGTAGRSDDPRPETDRASKPQPGPDTRR